MESVLDVDGGWMECVCVCSDIQHHSCCASDVKCRFKLYVWFWSEFTVLRNI